MQLTDEQRDIIIAWAVRTRWSERSFSMPAKSRTRKGLAQTWASHSRWTTVLR